QVRQQVRGVGDVAGRLHEAFLVRVGVALLHDPVREEPVAGELVEPAARASDPPADRADELSMTIAKRSNRMDSFMSVVGSRMSAAMTNIWRGLPSITLSSRSSRRNRCSQSGGAWDFSSRAVRVRSD